MISERDGVVTAHTDEGEATVVLPGMPAEDKAELLRGMREASEKRHADLVRFCAENGLALTRDEGGTQVITLHNIVDDNGKTIRDNNLETTHKIPIGTLVETTTCGGRGPAQSQTRALMYVVDHNRDCDGTPLYALSMTHPSEMEDVRVIHVHGHYKMPYDARRSRLIYYKIDLGYPEHALKVVKHPVYDPSVVADRLPDMLLEEYGSFALQVLRKAMGDFDEAHTFDPGDYPEKTCYVLIRGDSSEGPDFEAMRDNREGVFKDGAQPFWGSRLEVHSPVCLSIQLDRGTGAWEAQEAWEKGATWEEAERKHRVPAQQNLEEEA